MSNSISGNCGSAFCPVNLSGDATAQTVSDNNGDYIFSSLSNGNYTITPDLNHNTAFNFTPTDTHVTISGADVTGVDFTCPPVNFTHSGNVGIYSKNVVYYLNLGETVTRETVTADGSGHFSVTIPTTAAKNGVLMQVDSNGNWY